MRLHLLLLLLHHLPAETRRITAAHLISNMSNLVLKSDNLPTYRKSSENHRTVIDREMSTCLKDALGSALGFDFKCSNCLIQYLSDIKAPHILLGYFFLSHNHRLCQVVSVTAPGFGVWYSSITFRLDWDGFYYSFFFLNLFIV